MGAVGLLAATAFALLLDHDRRVPPHPPSRLLVRILLLLLLHHHLLPPLSYCSSSTTASASTTTSPLELEVVLGAPAMLTLLRKTGAYRRARELRG